MPRYRIVHRETGEIWEVEADTAENARRVVGWKLGACRIILLREGPFLTFEPPKVAAQVKPPIPGTGYICPDCHVTLAQSDHWMWWHCPSCELLYHAVEKKYYREDELEA